MHKLVAWSRRIERWAGRRGWPFLLHCTVPPTTSLFCGMTSAVGLRPRGLETEEVEEEGDAVFWTHRIYLFRKWGWLEEDGQELRDFVASDSCNVCMVSIASLSLSIPTYLISSNILCQSYIFNFFSVPEFFILYLIRCWWNIDCLSL